MLYLAIILILVGFNFKACNFAEKYWEKTNCIKSLEETKQELERLRFQQRIEAETRAKFQIDLAVSQTKIDTLKAQMQRKQIELQRIRKKKANEKANNYSNWSNDQLGKFLNDRYPNSIRYKQNDDASYQSGSRSGERP